MWKLKFHVEFFVPFQIHDGDSSGPLISTLCSAEIPNPIFSTGNKLTLHSWTESSSYFQSYDIIYTTTDAGMYVTRTMVMLTYTPHRCIRLIPAARCGEIALHAADDLRCCATSSKIRSWNVAVYFNTTPNAIVQKAPRDHNRAIPLALHALRVGN